MFRFLHAADVHLDSPLVGLDRYESAPVEAVRGATRRAFENLVRLAIDEEVAFVLLAGDLYDGDWKDYRTGLFFVEQMAQLREAGIPVFVIAGNHDAASQLTKNLSPFTGRASRRGRSATISPPRIPSRIPGFSTLGSSTRA
jgi:exonuclease SbcD